MNWFWPKAVPEPKKTQGPYRTIAEVPPQPKVETEEERKIRMEAEKRNRNAVAAVALATVPSVALLAIGAEWSAMSSAMAAMSIVVTILMTIGCVIAASIKLDW